jgi:methyl-accepting chemotaxis protein
VQGVTTNVTEGSSAAGGVAKDIALVDQSANDMASASSQVSLSAGELSQLAERLQGMVTQFKV